MQFLPSFHIVLTCSFVVLLAYLLSRLLTCLAHSVINGSAKARTTTEGSSRSRRIESSQRQQIEIRNAPEMARLQEDDENEDEDDTVELRRRAVPHTSKHEIGGGIFDAGTDQECNVKRDDGKQAASWDTEETMEEERMYAADNGGLMLNMGGLYVEGGGGYTTQLEYKGSGEDGEGREGDAGKNGLLATVDNFQEGQGGSQSVLGDAQGSSSLQQRLPPTWSDLERIVNMSSKKHSPPPSVAPLLSEE